MIGLGIARLYAAQCWVTAVDGPVPVRSMSDRHLANAIAWAQEANANAPGVPERARWRRWLLPMLLRERARRDDARFVHWSTP